MKHLPNLLTLSNLLFGCIAISYILSSSSYLNTVTGEDFSPVLGVEQLYMGSIFIALAAVMDVLDGLAARLLGVHSSLGRDLDSLADLVSFGVAPSMILFKLLWLSYMAEPGALDTPLIVMVPAFFIAVFAAIRLAIFNQTSQQQTSHFIGMPVPAVGILIASFPLIAWFNPLGVGAYLINRWVLYLIIILVCYLMVSKVRFFKWKGSGKSIYSWWPQILMAVIIVFGIPFLSFAIIPVAFLVYVLISLGAKISNKNIQ